MTLPTDPQELAEAVLDRLGGRSDAIVTVQQLHHGLTRFANSRIHQHVGEVTTAVDLYLQRGQRAASSSTSRVTDEGLDSLLESTLAAMEASPEDPDLPTIVEPHDAPPIGRPDPSTVEATPDDRADVVAAFVAADNDSDAAGYAETQHLVAALATTTGHRTHDQSTRATLDGIHRDGTAAGAGHDTSTALADLDGAAAGARAVAGMQRSRDAIEVEPGHWTVVLGPEAVATITIFLALYGYNGLAVEEQRSFVRLGEQQFDPTISIRDDAGSARSIAVGFDVEGTARRPLTLVDDGRSVAIAHDRATAARAGASSTGHHIPGSRTVGPVPTSLLVSPGDTPPTDLIAGVERGLYVTSFNYCRVLDPRTIGVTGLTRNGTFLIEDGQLGQGVQNLRFTQSFVEALAPGQVRGVGKDDRHADSEFGPGLVIAPSLALESWNFTGGASG
jgi:predicted Zn-dependent protease